MTAKILGPFDKDDFWTMNELKKDLEFAQKNSKTNPDYKEHAKAVARKLKGYLTKQAA